VNDYVKNFRLLPIAVACLALLASCRTSPPKEEGQFRPPDLVELVKLDPSIHLDIRYATSNNFMGRPMYREARAFLQRPAAEALARAHQQFRAQGYGLLIFDGYRPWSVTKAFWEAATPEQRRIGFVANPARGSKHNRGCAVDLTLFELSTGKEVLMPSGYDEFSERASPSFEGGPPEARQRRDLLRAAMEAQGFKVIREEWWHFDYQDWKEYRIQNIPFKKIRGSNNQ